MPSAYRDSDETYHNLTSLQRNMIQGVVIFDPESNPADGGSEVSCAQPLTSSRRGCPLHFYAVALLLLCFQCFVVIYR
jgi:hypothetical protein